MNFSKLAEYFESLEKTASRLEMTRILAEVFKQADEREIDKICYLSLGRLVPLYESLEFNLAEKMVMRAMAQVFGVDVKVKYKELGDLGLVVTELSKHKSTKSIKSVIEVYLSLRQIAEDSGAGSQERKVTGLAELMKSLDGVSNKYVVRMVVGRLRLGFSTLTMIDALSWMKAGDKSLRKGLEQAYFVRADVGLLARMVAAGKNVKNITPTLGVPVVPALCQRLKTAQEMIERMGKVYAEPKFDGTRVQIHIRGKDFLRTFTRNLEETTASLPELSQAYKQVKAESVILDSEAMGVSLKTGKLLSFQEMIVRRRKHLVEETSKLVPLKFFVFDVLYKDGESLIDRPLNERKQILAMILESNGVLELTESIATDDPMVLKAYHHKQLAQGLEGVVVKKWGGKYLPGRREFNWVKFKEEETAAGKLADTLDCVVMGYYRGRGKRAKFGIGAFLVGVRDKGNLVTIAKVGTGLSDEQWKQLKVESEKLKALRQPKEYRVSKSLIPDVWVEPKMVVEIAADNVTVSPNHSAGLGLRFPRLVRFREDKALEQVTSLAELRQL